MRAPDQHPRTLIRTLGILFFCSGFPALIYQLVWQRALFGMFGVNAESVTVIVAAFMLGLGLGSVAGGWLSRRRSLPLLPLLASIELLTACFGLASPSIFAAVDGLVLGASLTVTAAVALGLVLVPTLLMGATLPVLVGEIVRRTANVGGAVGGLYDVNTLGAGVACLVSTVALFPFVGMRGALLAAVAMNLAVAAGALTVHLRSRGRSGARVAAAAPVPGAPPRARPALGPAAAVALSAGGGFIALSFEIFFFRTVSYATGSSASAFALTLFAFLVGLAAGSRRAARRCRISPDLAARDALGDLVLATAVGWAFLPAFGRAAMLGWGALAVALGLVYLFARSWGVLFPTIAHLAVPADDDAGMGTARLYLANILGSASGSVVTGFVLLEHLTLVALGQALVAVALACAAALGLLAPRSGRAPATGAVLLFAGALAVAALPRITPDLLERLLWKRAAGAKERFARVVENRSGIIAVDPSGTVFGHGMYDGRFNTDLVHDTNGIFRAYALGLFHPEPLDVLMVGLSSGSWAQVVASHPAVRSVTIVEINPGYASLVASTPAVASVLANPKVRIDTDDARRWLRRHPDLRFDAIVANTTYHFRANASALLSLEFLALVREHLKPGGIALYNTTGSARVQRTGCLAFPHGVRLSNQLVVSSSPLDVDFARWRATLEAYRIDGRPVLDPARDGDRRALAGLLSLEAQLAGGAHGPDAAIERCPAILARTAGLEPVTDDNMGTEWRFALGLE